MELYELLKLLNHGNVWDMVFKETVIARDYQDARQVALARNPGAQVIGVTAVFK